MNFTATALVSSFLFFGCLSAHAQQAETAAQVTVSAFGNVQNPGTFTIPVGGRVSDLLIAARPSEAAYLPGLMFKREQARLNQLRLRAGLLHDLSEMQRSSKADVQTAASALAKWLDNHHATGRVLQQSDFRLLQVQPRSNPALAAGDSLTVPTRPKTIRIIGAVAAYCELEHIPLRNAQDYLHDCPSSTAADRNYVYVIQPDGTVQQLGVAAWNRADPQTIAPGGSLYIPFAISKAGVIDDDFNHEFAAFIATQPMTP